MSEKLSERLSSNALAYALLGETELPALLREAAAAVRAVEDAHVVRVRGKVGDVCMVPVSHDFFGKRVKLVEVG